MLYCESAKAKALSEPKCSVLQIYVDKADMEATREGSFSELKQLVDLGDIIGVSGGLKVCCQLISRGCRLYHEVFGRGYKLLTDCWCDVSVTQQRTEKGELSVKAHTLEMLSKAIMPLPDKWHGENIRILFIASLPAPRSPKHPWLSIQILSAGLSDVEKRYRQRYVDMIVTPGVTDTFRTRARITSVIRRELENRGFLEVIHGYCSRMPAWCFPRIVPLSQSIGMVSCYALSTCYALSNRWRLLCWSRLLVVQMPAHSRPITMHSTKSSPSELPLSCT